MTERSAKDHFALQGMQRFAQIALSIDGADDVTALEARVETRFALLHALALLGEAAARVSSEARSQIDEIPWRAVVGMRNKLLHAYDDVDLAILATLVRRDLPALARALTAFLGDEPK